MTFPIHRSKSPRQVKNFDWQAELNQKDYKHVPRTVPLALNAAREAVKDANIDSKNLTLEEKQNFGVILGTGGGGLAFTEQQYKNWFTGAEKKPAFTRFRLRRTAVYRRNFDGFRSARIVARRFDRLHFFDRRDILCRAAYRARQAGNMMLAGGVDAPLARGILEGFNLMTVLTKEWNDQPERASRPFDKNRSGMVLGEGAWIYFWKI